MFTQLVRALAACSAVTLALSAGAQAAIIVDSSVGGAPTGVTYVDFNLLPLGNAGGTSGGLTVLYSGTGQTVLGTQSGFYAAPVLSNNNGAVFGSAANGPDSTRYLSTGIGTVTLLLPGDMQYFGLLWGSVDNYNSLEFWDGAVMVGNLTGTDVWAGANGNQGANGTFYVNVNSTLAFDRVVAKSTQYAFEFDNVSYNPASTVPEPATLAIFGTLVAGLALVRRRREN
jgi:hypothetical protein